jgi:hypothetical protein
VKWAIHDFGTFKTAEEDGIFPGLLQHITKIFVACLAYGYMPLA